MTKKKVIFRITEDDVRNIVKQCIQEGIFNNAPAPDYMESLDPVYNEYEDEDFDEPYSVDERDYWDEEPDEYENENLEEY